jgi:hypothetical protein
MLDGKKGARHSAEVVRAYSYSGTAINNLCCASDACLAPQAPSGFH